jgi:prefoldin subunit 5
METQYTYEFLQQRVKSLETEVEMFKGQVDFLTGLQNNTVSAIEQVRDWTLEQISNGAIEMDVAQELAGILQFELKQEFEVCVQVEYNFTVKASTDSEVQDIIDNIDVPRLDIDECEDGYIWGEIVDSNYVQV